MQCDAEGPVALGDRTQVADDLRACTRGHGLGGQQGDVGGDQGSLQVPQAQAQLGELGDPGLRDRDDDAQPVLAGGALREEHR